MNRKMIKMSELIAEISMGPFGSDITVDNYVKEGVPVLNGSNLSGVKMTEDFINYLNPEKAASLKKANAKRGDIVVTHRGTLGQISYIPYDSKLDKYVISQSQFRVTLKTDLIDPIYFVYYFHTKEGQKRLLSFKNHVGVPALAQATTNFRLLEFPYIPLEDQKRISNILSSLDSKIELNNRINQELEGMAKLLYDYWFVQFDFPISEEQAIAMGKPELKRKPYKSSGGPMVYNEQLKREVPEGWGVKKLKDIESNIVTGKTPPTIDRENFDGGVPFICIGDIRGNMHVVRTELSLSEKGANLQRNKFIPKGALCVTCIASPGLLAFASQDSQTNQQINSIIFKKKKNGPYCYFYLKDYFLFAKGAKTGNTFANMNKEDFSAIPLIQPSEDILHKFYKTLNPIFDKILSASLENQKLTELRDWLLPMLMNGQVRVGEAKKEYLTDDEVLMAAEEREEYEQ